MKIVYIGIDILFQALPALAGSGCVISEIVTCPTDNKTEFNLLTCDYARRNHIPLLTGRIGPKDLGRWKKAGVDAVICCGYYYRIPVDKCLPMVNVHPSLLPEGRGAWPMPVTILRGMRESGLTIHKIAEGFDEGDILLQKKVEVLPEETLQTLTEKLQALLPGMLRELTADFTRLYEQARPQEKGEYWPCPEEKDYPITPETDFSKADRILRAFYGYECIYRKEEECYGLTGGRAYPDASGEKNGLPVCGGIIIAKRVRKL